MASGAAAVADGPPRPCGRLGASGTTSLPRGRGSGRSRSRPRWSGSLSTCCCGRREPGQEVGQGVLCLRDIIDDQARREQERKQQQGGAGLDDSYREGEEGDRKGTVLTHVDICHGGKLVGSVSVQVRMSIRRLSQAPAAEGASAEVALGEGADG